MANPERNRKLLVRSVFATGSTLAILLGAQSLALSDARQYVSTPDDTPDDTADVVSPVPAEESGTEQNLAIVQAAPSITILRQAGNPNLSSSTNNSGGQNLVMEPPAASLAATPEPMIVQSQPQQTVITVQSGSSSESNRQQTRSSR